MTLLLGSDNIWKVQFCAADLGELAVVELAPAGLTIMGRPG